MLYRKKYLLFILHSKWEDHFNGLFFPQVTYLLSTSTQYCNLSPAVLWQEYVDSILHIPLLVSLQFSFMGLLYA